MTLIDRLRTGTHEQAVGLLIEVQEAVKPQPSMDSAVRAALNSWFSWKAAFDALLHIGTPEACVGAAMMLIPEGAFYAIITDGDDTSKVSAFCADPKQERPPLKYIHGNTPALALAAAIMETRNV